MTKKLTLVAVAVCICFGFIAWLLDGLDNVFGRTMTVSPIKLVQQGTPVHPKVRCNPCTWDGHIAVKHWRSEPAVL